MRSQPRSTPRRKSKRLRFESLEPRNLMAITVNTLVDEADGNIHDGDVSLRDAIASAEAGETIDFALELDGQTLQLTQGSISITKSLTIDASTLSNGLTISASGSDSTPTEPLGDGSRVLKVDDGVQDEFINVGIRGLTITGGDVAGSGGGIHNRENLTIEDSTITGNTAIGIDANGGGIYSRFGTLSISRSTIHDNHVTGTGADGGGLYNRDSDATIVASTISSNTTFGTHADGGGVFVRSSNFRLIDSSVVGNATLSQESGFGKVSFAGGVNVSSNPDLGQEAWIINSTISGNSSNDGGGGGLFVFHGTAHVLHSTITNNSAPLGRGAGIASRAHTGAITEIRSSIVSGNDGGDVDHVPYTADDSLENTFVSLGHNLIGTGSSLAMFGVNDLTGVLDPGLEALADNGGLTLTHALEGSSLAINAGDPNAVLGANELPEFDQRGARYSRVTGGRIDIGAFESTLDTTLTNGPGEGSLLVTVEATGTYGSNASGGGSDAEYDPIGELHEGDTTYYSGVAFRSAQLELRDFLDELATNATIISASPTRVVSQFTVGPLRIVLTQDLAEIVEGSRRVGSKLTQAYFLTNTAETAQQFELIRYMDGDLEWANGVLDAGGRQLPDGVETLYETDTVNQFNSHATYVGISSSGGVAPSIGRYEIDHWSTLKSRILNDNGLNDSVLGDLDGDGVIDDASTDIALALRSVFNLEGGESTSYTTTTVFGTGAFADTEPTPPPDATLPREAPAGPIFEPNPIEPVQELPPSREEEVLVFAVEQRRPAPTRAATTYGDYGSGGDLPRKQSATNSANGGYATLAVDLAIGNDELDDDLVLSSFLDFADPEQLIIDLGDEPPAQVKPAAAATETPATAETSSTVEEAATPQGKLEASGVPQDVAPPVSRIESARSARVQEELFSEPAGRWWCIPVAIAALHFNRRRRDQVSVGGSRTGERVTKLFAVALMLIGGLFGSEAHAQSTDAGRTSLFAAEHLIQENNPRPAATLLERIVDGDLRAGSSTETVRRAARLLAFVYADSGEHTRAVAIGEQYLQHLGGVDSKQLSTLNLDRAELAASLAECYAALGQREDAQRELAIVKKIANSDLPPSVDKLRLRFGAMRLAKQLNPNSSPPGAIDVDLDSFRDEQRFAALVLCKEQSIESDNPAAAVELLTAELDKPVYTREEQSELRFHLADCYRRLATQRREAGEADKLAPLLVAERQLLENTLHDLANRRKASETSPTSRFDAQSQAGRMIQLARILNREGTVRESLAEVARESAKVTKSSGGSDISATQQLEQAAVAFKRLDHCSRDLKRLDGVPIDGIPMAMAGAGQFRDDALSGLQRVYNQLRQSPGQNWESRVRDPLLDVSRRLVELRSERLLPGDPALLDAKRALAYVYSSLNQHEQAEPIFRELVATWRTTGVEDSPQLAQAMLGLAETLRALNRVDESRTLAQDAEQRALRMAEHDDAAEKRDALLLAAKSENLLAALAIASGTYDDALTHLDRANARLEPYWSAGADIRQSNEQMRKILSSARVYRALLHQAEAQFEEAAEKVREGRELREQSGQSLGLLSFHLAEASIHLAWAKSAAPAERMSALTNAARSLDAARPLVDRDRDAEYLYLRGVLLRLNGESEAARRAFLELAQRSEGRRDWKTAAKSYVELARIVTDSLPTSVASSDVGESKSAASSDKSITALRDQKLQLRAPLERASDYATRAVANFTKLDGPAAEDGKRRLAYPALHFQASFLAAQLHVHLGNLAMEIGQLDALLASDSAAAAAGSMKGEAAKHRRAAIDLLQRAVAQAELPATSTTQQRADRARFFTRYAPAYNLLVDLCVGEATEGEIDFLARVGTPEHRWLTEAIRLSDLSRNRTFREQIEGWRDAKSSGGHVPKFDWNRDIARLAPPSTALLIYHLGNEQEDPQRSGGGIARQGAGHLFVVLDQGREIRYFALADRFAEAAGGAQFLTRRSAARYAGQQLEWLAGRRHERKWGRRSQQRLTASVFPPALVSLFAGEDDDGGRHPLPVDWQNASDAAAPNRLVIIPDGPLHQLPFESLLLPPAAGSESAGIRYLLDVLPPISYGPSLSVLAAVRSRDAAADSLAEVALLSAGDPAYPGREAQRAMPAWRALLDNVHVNELRRLAFSAEECNAVSASFDDLPTANRAVLLRDDATELNVRQHFESSRIIHLAVHGCVDHENDNLFGALALTPGVAAGTGDNDGLLQLREIYQLDLSNCELAVLSACETNIGADRPLEAGMSMARAFLEQGAGIVVCSQWCVDDQASSQLVGKFFAQLQSMRRRSIAPDYALALRNAKRELRADSNFGAHPKFWSPFVLVGDGPRPASLTAASAR